MDGTHEVLADAQQAVWLWKSPEMLAICVAIVRYVVEHGPCYADEVPLEFVDESDRNLIGNCWLPLKRRGLVTPTMNWRRSRKVGSKCRVVWEYRVGSASLCRAFLERNGEAVYDPQGRLLI